ncbi:MAG: alpha-glucosidase [Oscillospiraceae bacterium]|jgi:oligo-1,6-glucosidase|nr:alpha-glucosidase [Oscillospiraceae bacterium]
MTDKQTNNQWWKSAAVYQIYPKSFCDSNGDGIGDIPGIISKLDYLKNLGIDVLWLSPVYKSPGFDGGYDISDYLNIDPAFGSMGDFRRLLEEVHSRGAKLIMDLVVNHSSNEHPWFIESCKSKDSPYRDYYIWRDGKNGGPPNNWTDFFSGASCWEYSETTGQYNLHLFSKRQPDLNWDNPALRREIYSMMRQWLDMGVDGFRMDVISYISKPEGLPDVREGQSVSGLCANGPHVHEYLREMRREVLDKYDCMTVGETAGVTVEEAKKYASLSGDELNMVFHFEANDLDGGENYKWNKNKIELPGLKQVYTKWQKELSGKAWNSLYLSNHDQPRSVSRLGSELEEYRERSQKLLATCAYLMQGTPFIYQGEELAMTSRRFASPDELRDIEGINAYKSLIKDGLSQSEAMEIVSLRGRDSARTPMQWSGEPGAGFTSGVPWLKINGNYAKINAAEQVARPDSVYNYYRRLIALRKSDPVFTDGEYVPIFEERGDVFAYLRVCGGKSIAVLGNYSAKQVSAVVSNISAEIMPRALIGNIKSSVYLTTGILQPYEAIVLEINA